MKEGLVDLILFLTAAIDSGQNSSITLDEIKKAISSQTIFHYLKTQVDSPRSLQDKIFKKSEKEHLMLHWQFLLNEQPFENNFGVNKNPLCVLLTLAAISIQ